MLKIVIDKNAILEPLSLVVGITEKKSLMPYLSNVHIRFGERPYIYSTDLDISAVAFLEHRSGTEHSIVVNGRKLYQLLRELDKGDLLLLSEGSNLVIRQGKTEYSLTLYEPEEFPEIPSFSGDMRFTISSDSLIELLDSVSFAIGTDESRYILTGVFFKVEPGRLTVVATDGYRMALRRRNMEELDQSQTFILPAKTVRELERVLKETEEVVIEVGKTLAEFKTKRFSIISRLLEGQYPDYESAIPKRTKGPVKVEREALYRGLRRVSAIMSKNEPLLLKVSNMSLEISSESETGRAKESIDVSYDGEETELHLNGKFLMEAISHTKGDLLNIKLPEDQGPILIEETENEEYLNVIMPIRV